MISALQGEVSCYKIAGIPIAVRSPSGYICRLCADYATEDEPQYVFEITPADIAQEREMADGTDYSDGYLSSLALYRAFCTAVAERGVILFHSSAVSVDGKAYIFTAPSGTGKSTHTRLWREVFGARAVMINDDKPLIAFEDGRAVVYGTPWMGKHHLGADMSAPIAGICFLSRGEENQIARMPAGMILPRLLSQTFRPAPADAMEKVLGVLVRLSASVPVWGLQCNMSPDAARVSYGAMSGENPTK